MSLAHSLKCVSSGSSGTAFFSSVCRLRREGNTASSNQLLFTTTLLSEINSVREMSLAYEVASEY